jgi:hypothetical protein
MRSSVCQLLAAGGSVERALFQPMGSDGEGQPCRLKPLRLSTAPAAVSFLVWRNESPRGAGKLPQGRGRAATSGVMALDDVSRPSPYCNGLLSLMRRRFALTLKPCQHEAVLPSQGAFCCAAGVYFSRSTQPGPSQCGARSVPLHGTPFKLYHFTRAGSAASVSSQAGEGLPITRAICP